MKKLLLLAALYIPSAAYCDIQHSITSSVKLESLSAATSADKIGSSYSISGNNITTTDSNSAATIGGFGSVVLFISVYPVMPFLAIISFMIAFLKYFFHRIRKL